MILWTLTKKELRLLSRDRLSAGILIGMPLLFIIILGLLLGEGFGQKPDDRLRVSIVDLDEGLPELNSLAEAGNGKAILAATTVGHLTCPGGAGPLLTVSMLAPTVQREKPFPHGKWSEVVIRDLRETSKIRVEIISSLEEAQRLTNTRKRSAVVVLQPDFSKRMAKCSFLADGRNPFFRDGVNLTEIGITVIEDKTQVTGAAVIKEVTQVALLRVLLPYMIGQAFEKLADPSFVDQLLEEVSIPKIVFQLPGGKELRSRMGPGIQRALKNQFPKYNLTGKTWAALTKAKLDPNHEAAELTKYEDRDGIGFLNRGAARYQLLVPAYGVLFAFSLVLTVGWLFVLERRQGTLTRLRAAPITRTQILLGKFVPCFVISVVQGVVLLSAGKLIFGMSWGSPQWSLFKQASMLLPVVVCTSLAAMGLSLFVAALTRTEMQVALVGSLLVLMLGLLSGCLIPREILPESMTQISRVTPHAWALDAYQELLVRPTTDEVVPNLEIVRRSCWVLVGFGAGFLTLAWGLIRLR